MMDDDNSARVQYLLQRNLKLVTEICRLRVVNANLQRKNSTLSREILVRTVKLKKNKSTQTTGLEKASPYPGRTQDTYDRCVIEAEYLSPNKKKSWHRLSFFENAQSNSGSFDNRFSTHTKTKEECAAPDLSKPAWASPAITRVAVQLSKRIARRYTSQSDADVNVADTESEAHVDVSSRSPQRSVKSIITIDDIEEDEEDEEIDKKMSRQLAALEYSESRQFTSDLLKSVDKTEPTHNHSHRAAAAAAEPVEETRRARRGTAKPLSYKEPALNTKIRKGTKFFVKV